MVFGIGLTMTISRYNIINEGITTRAFTELELKVTKKTGVVL